MPEENSPSERNVTTGPPTTSSPTSVTATGNSTAISPQAGVGPQSGQPPLTGYPLANSNPSETIDQSSTSPISSNPLQAQQLSHLARQTKLYDNVDDAFQLFNEFAFRGRHDTNLRHASETSSAGRAFRRAVLNYGRRYDFLFLELDFSAVEVTFIFTAGKYGPDARQYLEKIHQAVHAYLGHVDSHELEALALNTQQLEAHMERVLISSTFDI
ncbi:hypothetical protein F5882DRAFT_457574 [Hyaloscypha sp. PMI_1271]|nr:hypothetical protein F5882DRAFT_472150 [Hyaloscypha sp. PMI_1271]KAH8744018.1 hypothetical protein F5882DRAFT_446583 [Hyaloscypha sp. PMI_1271]KAH8746176.1 hypothetical protein F5882DRAFT_525738 [Hyaloscypha sp. PMI_1271]KAH8799867.1 hypothetical protein F5882DRAFT_457574 [Hyaloscypha sp. PMI_1271]